MGGPGSGDYLRWSTKSTIGSQHRVDIRRMRQQGRLEQGTSGWLSWSWNDKQTRSISYRVEADCFILNYRWGWEDVQETVMFDWTACNYGGKRAWFLCPGCNRRVAVLYGAGRYFWCRHCYNLTYASQQVQYYERLMNKASAIRERLGGSINLSLPFPEKPKGMHWGTYQRLREEAKQANRLSWLLIGKQFGF
jgi:hypothetical protein